MFANSSKDSQAGVALANDQAESPPSSGQSGYPDLIQSPTTQREGAMQKVRNFRVEFGPSRKDILNFTNQLAVMVRAGIRSSGP
jgi:type II secretory pathway component PulF